MSNSSLVVIGADFADTLCCCISGSEVHSELSARTEKKGGGCVSNNVALVLGWAVLSGRGNKTGIDRDRPCMTSHRFSVIRMTLTQSSQTVNDSSRALNSRFVTVNEIFNVAQITVDSSQGNGTHLLSTLSWVSLPC